MVGIDSPRPVRRPHVGGPRPGRLIARPRLTGLLRGRFDHRVTSITAPAGAGKTTSLRLAMQANAVDPFGVDVYYAVSVHDRDPSHFLGGVAEALGRTPGGGLDDTAAAIADAVWTAAPRDVVIMLDDVHLLDGSDSVAWLSTVLQALPSNGHLLLSSRTPAEIALARLLAHGQVLELVSTDLGLDDDELAELINLRLEASTASSADLANLPRLAGVADLRLRAGPGADTQFLWEEVLGSLDEHRRTVLQRAAVLQLIDDELVEALSGGTLSAADLVAGLPLVEAGEDGTYRMHPILQAALRERTSRRDLIEMGRQAAEIELARGNHRAAIELFMDAGDRQQAIEVARRFARLPLMRRTFGDLLVVRSLVDQLEPGSALGEFLRAESQLGELSTTTDVSRVGDNLLAAARRARLEGDNELEAIALYGAWLWLSLDGPLPAGLVDRMVELAATVAFAHQTVRFALAEEAMFAGDPQQAMALVGPDHPHGGDADVELMGRAGLLCSLGRPEQVGAGLTTADLAGMPDGAELYVGFALWNRGQLTPEQALPIALAMTAQVLARRVVHPIVAILGVTTFMAVAAGDLDTAQRHVQLAREKARFGCSAHLLAFTAMAEGATVLTTTGEAEAGRLLGTMLAAIPIGQWPIRAYLLGLPMLYLLRPETRTTLDACEFGPALSLARDAGRALVELRSTGSVDGAAALPWHRDVGLRAHVMPVHLCELALAAELAGVTAAADLVDRLPGKRASLRRVAAVSTAPIADLARRRLDRAGARADLTVTLRTLGQTDLAIDGRPIDHPDWSRTRVRELFALVAVEGRISRARILALCWPELDQAHASRNLRVTLTYLNRALVAAGLGDPERSPVVSLGNDLLLELDITCDVDQFDALMRQALDHDRAGSPAAALDLYQRALASYGGDYLADLDAEWLRPNRTRLQLLATGGMLRVGELELAAGEPSRAVQWATRASTQFPANERAGRLLAACHVSIGARSTAATLLRDLIAALRADGVEPEPETLQALHRLTVR